jgi:hypothetical protein
MRRVTALLGAIFLAVIGSMAEALWRPIADYAVNTKGIDWFGEEWIGIEVEADKPPKGSKTRGGCPLRDDDSDRHRIPAHLSVDRWKAIITGDNMNARIIDENNKKFKIFGAKQGQWLVLTITNADNSHATLYLEKGSDDYYEGYQISNDCHSSVAGAAVMCPYVLMKGVQEQLLRKADSIKGLECQPLIPSNGLPPDLFPPSSK